MTFIPMVRMNGLVPLVGFLETIGAPVERLMQSAGLSPHLLTDPERLLPLHLALRFAENVARAEGQRDFGLVAGRHAQFAQLGRFARLVHGAGTVEEALNRLIAAIMLHNSGDRLWIDRCGTKAMLCHRYTISSASGQRQGELYCLGVMIDAVRSLLGPRWMPDGVILPAAEEPHRRRYEALLDTPVICSGTLQAVLFDTSLLGEPLHTLPCCCDRHAHEHERAMLKATAPATDFAGSVRQTIGALLPDGYPDVHRTAAAIGLSTRTLQRRLTERGESYSHLVDAARLEESARLLCAGRTKFIDIAGEVGYADAASFSRAFRRWTGMTPRAFRRRLPQNSSADRSR